MPGETFAQALAKVDVEVSDVRDSGAPVYTVLGLKEVEAAHRAEVGAKDARIARLEAALGDLSVAVAVIIDDVRPSPVGSVPPHRAVTKEEIDAVRVALEAAISAMEARA